MQGCSVSGFPTLLYNLTFRRPNVCSFTSCPYFQCASCLGEANTVFCHKGSLFEPCFVQQVLMFWSATLARLGVHLKIAHRCLFPNPAQLIAIFGHLPPKFTQQQVLNLVSQAGGESQLSGLQNASF